MLLTTIVKARFSGSQRAREHPHNAMKFTFDNMQSIDWQISAHRTPSGLPGPQKNMLIMDSVRRPERRKIVMFGMVVKNFMSQQ